MNNGFLNKNGLAILALVIALGAGTMALVAQKSGKKIAYAETNILLSDFTEAIAARKQFEEAQKEWDKNLKTLNDSLVASMNQMKKSYDVAKKDEKEKMRAGLQQKNDDLQRYTNAVKKMSQDKEKDLMDPVIKKLNGFMDLWGKQHGYDLILGTMTGGNILQANSDINVTASILKDLNEHYRNLPVAEEKKNAVGGVTKDTTEMRNAHEISDSIAGKSTVKAK